MNQCDVDIVIKQGANFYWEVEAYEEVLGVEQPRDLTNYTAEMIISETFDSDPLDTYSTAGGEISITALEGKLTINVLKAVTAAYPDNFKGVYDLKLTNPAATFTERLLQGKAVVSEGVNA